MPRDRTAYAKIRNRAETSHLQSELQRIEREKQNEMRTFDTERRRFRTRCSKLLLTSSSNSKAVGDGAHESQYKKSDENKTNSDENKTKSDISSVDLHDLVFTDGEVDAGKVLCLHLISAHRAETLTPPKKRLSYLCKEHSPTERILEKSRAGYANNEKLSKLLPMYTIELFEMGAMGENSLPPVINDGRLAARILINENLRQLIATVINALETSNREKLRQLVAIAQDPKALRTMLGRKDILDFVDLLCDQPIVNSSESFLLTPPFKIRTRDLNFRSVTGNRLECLIRSIRQNVLQIPTRKPIMDSEEVATVLEPQEISSRSSRIGTASMSSGSRVSSGFMDKNVSREVIARKQRIRSQEFTNFIAKNIREAAMVRRIEYDEDEAEEKFCKRSGTILPKYIPAPPPSTTSTEAPPPEKPPDEKENSATKSSNIEQVEKPNANPDTVKFRVKKIMCPACMEKWRTPLPQPKTPRLKTSSVVPALPDDPLKTDTRVRLNMLIMRERYALETCEKRCVSKNSPAVSGNVKRTTETSVVDVNFSALDLARIEQEIREKETQKKLEKFLNKSI